MLGVGVDVLLRRVVVLLLCGALFAVVLAVPVGNRDGGDRHVLMRVVRVRGMVGTEEV